MGTSGACMKPAGRNVLLLDLYRSKGRALIQPYLYLGAFLDALHIPYALYRWRGDDQELLEQIERQRIGHVFVNLIMGPVLASVEGISRLLKAHYPGLTIWAGGTASRYVRPLLERCPDIDRVSDGHPCYDPDGFAAELHETGLLPSLPAHLARFPPLTTNRYVPAFLHEHLRGERPVKAVNMSSAAGCPHRCSFCYLAGARPWSQPIDNLIADLAALQEQYDVRYFEFSDDNFPANPARLEAFCAAVHASGLDANWFCLSSLDVLDRRVLDRMCGTGLKRMYVGVDGIYSDRISELRKPYTPETARAQMDLLRAYPVDLTLAVVLGSSGETRAQIQGLYDWVAAINPELCEASFLTPYPGTLTYRQALACGLKPPETLGEWARVASLQIPKPLLNPAIPQEEYLEWAQRFQDLGTRRFRSGIGESVRRLQDLPARGAGETCAGAEPPR
jgi:hypothetical protein